MVITLNNKPLIEPFSIYIPGMSFEDLLKFANEDISCELLNGVLVVRSPASYQHETIFKFIITLLELYGSKYSLGSPLGSRFMIRFSDDWAPEPDIMFLVPNDKKYLKDNYIDGPPSVVFEILSKTTRNDDIEKKLPKYRKFGVKEMWYIDPENKNITLHSYKNSKTYKKNDRASSTIIKDFKIKVSWLWNLNDISVLDALKQLENIN
jgi:Uma2 family endonuclease